MTKRSDRPARADDGEAMAALEAAFAALRAEAPRPSAALMGRVLADAEAEAAAGHRRGGLAGLLAAVYRGLGGAPAAAGLAAATLAGVWIGASPPPLLDGLAAAVWAAPAEIDVGGLFDLTAIAGFESEETDG